MDSCDKKAPVPDKNYLHSIYPVPGENYRNRECQCSNQCEVLFRSALRFLESVVFRDNKSYAALRDIFARMIFNMRHTDWEAYSLFHESCDIFPRSMRHMDAEAYSLFYESCDIFPKSPVPKGFCGVMHILEALVRHRMSVKQRREYFEQLSDLYQIVLRDFPGPTEVTLEQEIAVDRASVVMTILVNVMKKLHPDDSKECVNFFENCDVTRWQWNFLDQMSPSNLDYIFSCFSEQRYAPSTILRKTDLLTTRLKDRANSVVLIRNGFDYSFNELYYQDMCKDLLLARTEDTDKDIISESIKDSRDLRMQMAIEIQRELFIPVSCTDTPWKSNKKPLNLLWKTVPYPFISSTEFIELFQPYYLDNMHIILEFCREQYSLKNPLGYPVPLHKQPRSLKHLARVEVRKTLIESLSFCEKAVHNLPIPHSLKDYLWKLDSF